MPLEAAAPTLAPVSFLSSFSYGMAVILTPKFWILWDASEIFFLIVLVLFVFLVAIHLRS